MQDEITILIADDHPLFRRGLRMVIEHDPELNVLAEVDDGLSALAQIEALEPDVVVLDINMPGADGLEVARAIQEKQFSTIPVFLTMHKEEAIFSAALDAGVRGFIVKDGAASEIVACIKAVMRGESFFSPLLAQFLVERRGRNHFSTILPRQSAAFCVFSPTAEPAGKLPTSSSSVCGRWNITGNTFAPNSI